MKEKVVEAENADPKEVEKIVTQAAEELEVNLSEADRQKIVDLMSKIDGLNLNIDDLKSQAKDLYDKLSKLDLNLSDADKEKVGNFFQRLWDGIVNFFDNFFN